MRSSGSEEIPRAEVETKKVGGVERDGEGKRYREGQTEERYAGEASGGKDEGGVNRANPASDTVSSERTGPREGGLSSEMAGLLKEIPTEQQQRRG